MEEKCIFCEIVKDNVLNYKISESKKFYCHIRFNAHWIWACSCNFKKTLQKIFLELEKEELNEGIQFVKKVANKLTKKLNCDGFNITTNINRCANQIIFHFHWHIIPRYKEKPYIPKDTRIKLSKNEFFILAKKIKDSN